MIAATPTFDTEVVYVDIFPRSDRLKKSGLKKPYDLDQDRSDSMPINEEEALQRQIGDSPTDGIWGVSTDTGNTEVFDLDQLPSRQRNLSPFPDHLEIDQDVRVHLSDRVQSVLNPLIDKIRLLARANYVPVYELRLHHFQSYEEKSSNIVLYQLVDLPPDHAMDYWKDVGDVIDYWVPELPRAERDILYDRIVTTVDWPSEAASSS